MGILGSALRTAQGGARGQFGFAPAVGRTTKTASSSPNPYLRTVSDNLASTEKRSFSSASSTGGHAGVSHEETILIGNNMVATLGKLEKVVRDQLPVSRRLWEPITM